MQGVYVEKTVTGVEGLRRLVDENPTRVAVATADGPVAILTRDQYAKYLEQSAMRAQLGLGSSGAEPILFEPEAGEGTEELVDGPLQWFVCRVRLRTKKALKEAVEADPSTVWLEATSVFGNEYHGPLADAPHESYAVVGPDPREDRSWYAQIAWSDRKKGWTVA